VEHSRRQRRRRRGAAFALAGVVASVALGTVLAWAGYTYLTLVEIEVEIADATSRLEAAGHGRAALVANLLETAGAGQRSETAVCLDKIARAAERAEGTALRRPVHRHPQQMRAVEQVQSDLSAALVEFWDLPPDVGGVDAALDGLASRIARSEQQMRDALVQLDRSLEHYDRALRSFPASLVVGLAGREPAESSRVGRLPG